MMYVLIMILPYFSMACRMTNTTLMNVPQVKKWLIQDEQPNKKTMFGFDRPINYPNDREDFFFSWNYKNPYKNNVYHTGKWMIGMRSRDILIYVLRPCTAPILHTVLLQITENEDIRDVSFKETADGRAYLFMGVKNHLDIYTYNETTDAWTKYQRISMTAKIRNIGTIILDDVLRVLTISKLSKGEMIIYYGIYEFLYYEFGFHDFNTTTNLFESIKYIDDFSISEDEKRDLEFQMHELVDEFRLLHRPTFYGNYNDRPNRYFGSRFNATKIELQPISNKIVVQYDATCIALNPQTFVKKNGFLYDNYFASLHGEIYFMNNDTSNLMHISTIANSTKYDFVNPSIQTTSIPICSIPSFGFILIFSQSFNIRDAPLFSKILGKLPSPPCETQYTQENIRENAIFISLKLIKEDIYDDIKPKLETIARNSNGDLRIIFFDTRFRAITSPKGVLIFAIVSSSCVFAIIMTHIVKHKIYWKSWIGVMVSFVGSSMDLYYLLAYPFAKKEYFIASAVTTFIVPMLLVIAHPYRYSSLTKCGRAEFRITNNTHCTLLLCVYWIIFYPLYTPVLYYLYYTKLTHIPFVSEFMGMENFNVVNHINIDQKWSILLIDLFIENIPQIFIQLLNNSITGWNAFSYASMTISVICVIHSVCIFIYTRWTHRTFLEFEIMWEDLKDTIIDKIKSKMKRQKPVATPLPLTRMFPPKPMSV